MEIKAIYCEGCAVGVIPPGSGRQLATVSFDEISEVKSSSNLVKTPSFATLSMHAFGINAICYDGRAVGVSPAVGRLRVSKIAKK
jgi:hypothetical protein